MRFGATRPFGVLKKKNRKTLSKIIFRRKEPRKNLLEPNIATDRIDPDSDSNRFLIFLLSRLEFPKWFELHRLFLSQNVRPTIIFWIDFRSSFPSFLTFCANLRSEKSRKKHVKKRQLLTKVSFYFFHKKCFVALGGFQIEWNLLKTFGVFFQPTKLTFYFKGK